MVLGCCPTSRFVDLAIHRHCLKQYHGLYMMLRKNYLVAIDRQMLHVGNRLKLIDELSICSPRWNDSSVVCSRPFPFFSLPPRGVGHGAEIDAALNIAISIHPPRVGWDSRSNRQIHMIDCLLLTKGVRKMLVDPHFMSETLVKGDAVMDESGANRPGISCELMFRTVTG